MKSNETNHPTNLETFIQIMDKYYHEDIGFGKHKPTAINLLKQITSILDEFDIKHCLISGTLLGYVRHNDFIPWDDDIDIIVDDSILDKIDNIIKKYGDLFSFMNAYNNIYKICFTNDGIEMTTDNHGFKKTMMNTGKYTWPFVDLFVYSSTEKTISFFHKEWPIEKFLPFTVVNFLGIPSNIPIDYDYFLKLNYNENYNTELISNWYCHKEERVNNIEDVVGVSMENYQHIQNMRKNNE
jgi:phosphorylcholine metabolism protein LicD